MNSRIVQPLIEDKACNMGGSLISLTPIFGRYRHSRESVQIKKILETEYPRGRALGELLRLTKKLFAIVNSAVVLNTAHLDTKAKSTAPAQEVGTVSHKKTGRLII